MKLSCLKKTNLALADSLGSCKICPRLCGADRVSGKKGYCRAGLEPDIYSYAAHHGEEPPISSKNGSGTIFFSHCNMRCVYCQNYIFSQLDEGKTRSNHALAEIMLKLQSAGCHNINLVSPSHYVPQIVASLYIAVKKGLSLPIVYNTSGYDLPETIKLLDGIVDIYLADMRYSDEAMARKYSDAPDYIKHNRASILEMQRQVGDLVIQRGAAKRGLIIRLLVMPNDISGTRATLKFIKENVSKNAHISIMSQYHPTYKAREYSEISRGVSAAEYQNIVDETALLGLNNGWIQKIPYDNDTRFLGTNIKPDYDKDKT